jgi:hypothetical protein
MLHTEQVSLTVLPNRQVTQAIVFDHLRMNSARVDIEELYVSLRVVESEVRDDLVCCRFGAAVAHGSRLVHLRRD